MPTLDQVKKNQKTVKQVGELPYNFPPEVLDGNKKHKYIEVITTDYGYDIVRRPSWLRDQKTRVLHIFNERRHQKYGVFPEGTNVCIAGWYEDAESCSKIIKSQRNHDHAVGLLGKAQEAFNKGFLEAASSIVVAALTKEKGNSELLALKEVLVGEIALAKADKMLENLELTETTDTQANLEKEVAKLKKQLAAEKAKGK